MRIGSRIVIYVSLLILFVAVVSDLCSGKIPNGWICVGMIAAAAFMAWPGRPFGWMGFLSGLLIPLIICWIPFRMGAIGAGDIKLMMVVGCLNGGSEVISFVFLSFLLAAGISLGRLLSLRQFKNSLICCIRYFQHVFLLRRMELYPERRQKGHTIHFSMAIFGGYVVWLGVNACRFIL